MVTPSSKAQAAQHLEQHYNISERRACRVLMLNRNSKRSLRDKPLIKESTQRVIALSASQLRWGYRKVHDRLKLDGVTIGRETVRLIRQREGLQVVRKQHKRRYPGNDGVLPTAAYPGHIWSYDFVMDTTAEGKRLKLLTVIDEFSKQALTVACRRSIVSADVVNILRRLFAWHGAPTIIRSDNGSEFIADKVRHLLAELGVKTHFIDPGAPWQNGCNESFNGIARDDCLNKWEFRTIQEARLVIDDWVHQYNDYRPHGSLDGLTPNLFLEKWEKEHGVKKVA